MVRKRRKTPEERIASARRQLEQWRKPIDSLEAWNEFERLTDIAEGRA